MDFERSLSGTWTLVAVKGRLDALGAPDLEREASSLLTEGVSHLALDLAGVPYLGSAGLRVFLGLHKRLSEPGCAFALLSPVPAAREVLEISGFTDILRILDDPAGLP